MRPRDDDSRSGRDWRDEPNFNRGDLDPFEHGQPIPTGPRTWGSGIGSGVQGRGMGQGSHSDPDYQQWRDEQLKRFDDDFEAFRRERYGKFADEFNTWRSNRANQKPSSEKPGTRTSDSSSSPAGSRPGEGSRTQQHS